MKKMLQSTDWAGYVCTLVDEVTGDPVYEGDARCGHAVVGGQAPHKSSSTGKVYVDKYSMGYYPSVVRAKWTRRDIGWAKLGVPA